MNAERFGDIMGEILMLAEEALKLTPVGFQRDRANAYWYNQIRAAVNGNSMGPMSDTLNYIDDGEDDDDHEEEDEDNESY